MRNSSNSGYGCSCKTFDRFQLWQNPKKCRVKKVARSNAEVSQHPLSRMFHGFHVIIIAILILIWIIYYITIRLYYRSNVRKVPKICFFIGWNFAQYAPSPLFSLSFPVISLQQNLQIVQERADVMVVTNLNRLGEALLINPPLNAGNFKCICITTHWPMLPLL